jgi:hypothetical protein
MTDNEEKPTSIQLDADGASPAIAQKLPSETTGGQNGTAELKPFVGKNKRSIQPRCQKESATAPNEIRHGFIKPKIETGAPSQTCSGTKMQVLCFCVPVSSSLDQFDSVYANIIHEDRVAGTSSSPEMCVVGTITVMDRCSAIVWMGWGSASQSDSPSEPKERALVSLCAMGPTVMAMPRIKFSGMPPNESPCTQLIGGENEDDQIIGWQMACRLSHKLGWPIVVSCSLASTDMRREGLGMATEDGLIIGEGGAQSHRAAALGEKEVIRLLSSIKK